MTPPTNSSFAELNANISNQFAEFKVMLADATERLRSIEMNQAGFEPAITSKIDAAFRRIDDHGNRISNIELEMKQFSVSLIELRQTNRILTWIGGLLGSTVILWLVSQIMKLL